FGVFDKAKVEIEAFGLTTPDAISVQRLLAESLAGGATRAVMEVSSHSLDQDRVAGVAFDTAIFTNLSRDHLDYHSDMDAYLAAKQKLFLEHRAQRAMINIDDPAGVRLAESLAGDVEVVSYGLGEADVCARDVALTSGGIEARVATPWGEGHLRSELLGEFNLYNLLAVIAAACSQGCELKAVLAAVAELKPVSGRMELVTSSATVAPHVIVDYAHTPDALAKALQSLRGHCNGDLWVVFGCGGDRDRGKRAEMGAVADAIADVVMITSDNPRSEKPLDIMLDIAAAVSEAHMVESRADAIKTSIAEADPGDTILIAGKGHEDYQVIGDQHLPFSDAETARSALEEIWGAGDE
ncbi:MAG: UDP-N-acetylmuramoyl-L-alanyl-D-glutamate--2,6-diaminopimelate ligase, partial [bacterium]